MEEGAVVMIKPTSIPPEPHSLPAQRERAQLRSATQVSTPSVALAPQEAPRPKAVAPTPLVPDMRALASGGKHETFDISAESLSDLLVRINITGAGVATRMGDATRRVQIASLGTRSAETPLVAQLRIAASPYSPARADPAEEERLREALKEAEQVAGSAPSAMVAEELMALEAAAASASAEQAPAPAAEAPARQGEAVIESAGGAPAPSPGTLVDVVG